MGPKKQQKMSLGDFLGDQSLGSWADEMEDMPVNGGGGGYGGGERRTFSSAGGGFGSDRGAGGGGFGGSDRLGGYAVREELPLPSRPPYTAHLGNLSFDATEGDINDFFTDCEVTNVRIVEDKLERKPKGFGYVEFGSVDGLKKALDLSGTQFQGRNIRVSVAEPPKDRPEQKDMSDWTRRGPLPDLPGQQRRPSERGGYRQFDEGSDAGGERRRPPPFSSDGKERDFGNWERKGPLSPVPQTGPMREGGRVRSNDGPRERRQSPAWGEGRSNDGSRPPRREFSDRPQHDRQPTAPELDNQWRTKMRPDAPVKSPTATPDASTPSSPAPQPAAPATRPKLNLAKRTISEAPQTPSAAAQSDSKSNPFGAARPIDTAAREREIEEKRQLAIRQKKESDDKAREERKAKDSAEKSVSSPKTEAPSTPSTEKTENGNEEKPRANFEILQRVGEEADVPPEVEAADAPANDDVVDDKNVKPKEVVRDTKQDNSWRRKSSTPAASTPTTTESMDDDGWSTVTKPTKNPRGGKGRGGPARAIAS
ncbi:Eukaryotic translation initiation factor 4B [Didymosphaeria variabile]|uniref:Eukaryotic translation initiation factor 4B n=1 Tax=Didymosphaeria variabile TaxID=1932322 RepID=A0A9W9CDQ8_9PLEO|nr:Eukaryotic translation initiation factor 4B [Didymosphaeria variabile]KAJ4356561.1 Eukaryotic translation initiation factor 4B [Didymosphaeria variabile]